MDEICGGGVGIRIEMSRLGASDDTPLVSS